MPDGKIGSREWRIHMIENYLIPRLDSPSWARQYETDSDSVEMAAETLAEEYHDLAVPEFSSTVIVVILLLPVDYLFYINPQVYGLFIDIWAALFFVFPSLKGRYVIASAAKGAPKEAIHRLEAQEMVSNNTGFVLLAFGFVLQILSVQFLPNSEFIGENILSTSLPSWMSSVLLLTVLLVGLKTLGRMRSRRLSG